MKRYLFLMQVAVLLSFTACGESPGDSDAGAMDAAPVDGSAADTGPVVLCAADSECDDGVYCNGAETCMIGEPGAGADGCLAGTNPCDAAAGETCDESAEACVAGGCDGDDADMDGDGDDRVECGGSDCDDSDANVYGTAQEVCDADGLDEDCDPSTIHDDSAGSMDGDGDGDGYVSSACFNPLPDGGENRGDDCDDMSADVHPGVTDGCGGGDEDCDGMLDEDPDRTFYEDVGGDGFGVVASTLTACSAPDGYAVNDGDCDDTNRNINPSRGEPCNGIDDDCSGVADDPSTGPACTCVDGTEQQCGPTTDVGSCTYGRSRCVSGAWGSCEGAVMPSAETCTVGDEDCDGLSNDLDSGIASGDPEVTGAFEWWRDMDRDGIGTSTDQVFACARPARYVAAGTASDCDDGNMAIYPGAPEECNGINDDCDALTDEGCDCTDGAMEVCPTGTNTGECVRGNRTCSGGRWLPCNGVTATAEVCNGLDDDCDGADDEDFDCVRNETETGNTMCGNPGSRMCTTSCTWATPEFLSAESAGTCDYCDDSGMGIGNEIPFASSMSEDTFTSTWDLFGGARYQGLPFGGGYYIVQDTDAMPGGVYVPTTIQLGYGPVYVNARVSTTARDSAEWCAPLSGSWSLVLLEETASSYLGTAASSALPAENGVAAVWSFASGGLLCLSSSTDQVSLGTLGPGGVTYVGSETLSAGGQDGPAGTTVAQQMTLLITPDDPRTPADESAVEVALPIGVSARCANTGPEPPCGMTFRPGTRLHTGIVSASNDISVTFPEIRWTRYSMCAP